MDLKFCTFWQGNGSSPDHNKFCRSCPQRNGPCQELWSDLRALANPTIQVPGTPALRLHRQTPAGGQNPDILYLQVNARWNLPIEDLLHYVKTKHGAAGQGGVHDDPRVSPSKTSQESFLSRLMPLLPPARLAAVGAIPRRLPG